MIINNLLNTDQMMEQEKKQILMENKGQKIVRSFFIRIVLKEKWDLLENNKNLKSIQKTFHPSLENRNVL